MTITVNNNLSHTNGTMTSDQTQNTALDLPPPTRPRSAYNFFFREERAKIIGVDTAQQNTGGDHELRNNNKKRKHRKVHGIIGFTELSGKWKNLDPKSKENYIKMFDEDKDRYQKELHTYIAKREASVLQWEHLAAVESEDDAKPKVQSHVSFSCMDENNQEGSGVLVDCLLNIGLNVVQNRSTEWVRSPTSKEITHQSQLLGDDYTEQNRFKDELGWDIFPTMIDEMLRNTMQNLENELKTCLGGEDEIYLMHRVLEEEEDL